MKTYIKSILALATATLLGSSAWAAVSFNPSPVTVMVGEPATVTATGGTADSTGYTGTWTTSFNPTGKATATATRTGNKTATITFTGSSAGSTTCTVTHQFKSSGTSKTETGTITVNVIEPKTVNLCVGDKVVFNFYGSSSSTRWTTTLNGASLTGTTAKSGNGSSFLRGNDARSFSMTVTAATAGKEDTLVVTSTAGTSYTYAYKFVVSEARTVGVNKTVDFTCASQASAAWTLSSTATSTATVTPSSATARTSVSGTVTGKAVGSTTLTVKNATTSGSGARGATYTLAVAVRNVESKSSETALFTSDAATDFQLESGSAFSQSVAWNSTVTSGDSDIATATMKNGTTATTRPTMIITPKGAGTTTLTVKNSSNTGSYDFTWTVTVTVSLKPTLVNLAVGDVFTPSHSWSGNQYWQATVTSGSGVTVNNTGVQGTAAYCAPQITATAAGTATVTVRRSASRTGTFGNYSLVDPITTMAVYEITVGAARTVPVEEPVDVPCVCSPDFPGSATWTAATVSPSGSATASYVSGSQSTVGATVRVTGAKTGDSTVTAKNVSNNRGATYALKFTFTAKPKTVSYKGVDVTYVGDDVEVKENFGTSKDLILIFKSGTGSVAPAAALSANVLVVGGGSRGSNGARYAGGAGGNGGEVVKSDEQELSAETYAVQVGVGQTAQVAATDSSLTGGSVDLEASAGTSTSTTGETLDISGSPVTYGKKGATGTQNHTADPGADNTGNGGQGGYNNSGSYMNGGNGGSGVVIVRFVGLPPTEGKDVMAIGQGRTKTYTTESDLTRAEVTAGASYIASCTVSGKTATIKAGTSYPQEATVKLYNGDTLVKVLTVHVTEAPKTINFKNREIEYLNAASATKINGEKELLITFTDTTKTGILTIPEDATARILVVGGGAGGVFAKSSTNNKYGGNGGCGGKVVEKTEADGYVLPAGSYAVTVGAGGVSRTSVTGNNDFTGENPGDDSSLVGGDVNLVAVGGIGYPTQEAQGTGTPGEGASGSKNPSQTAAAWDGMGAGAPGDGEHDHDKTGWTSSITGSDVVYGEGGAGIAAGVTGGVTGANGTNGRGQGGGGSANGSASGTGGSGAVFVRITYPDPVYVETFSVTPILQGDALFTSAITLSMTNAAGEKVAGTYDWTERDTVPPASGDYVVRFTPDDTTAYAVTDLPANVVVLVPQEPTVTVVADDEIAGEATTEVTADSWEYVVSSGADCITEPELTRNDDGTAYLKVFGKALGTAYVDLYGDGVFAKRVIVAVLPEPEESETISVEEGLSKTSAQTTASAAQWNYVVEVGADFIGTPTLSTGSSPTLTVTGRTAGTAIVDLYSGSVTPGQGTLRKRVIVNVVGPTEGYENRAVGTTLSITVKTEATVDDSKITSGSGVTVTGTGTSTTIRGGSTVGATAQVRLYADGTLVKVVNVQVTDKPSTITWKNRTVSYLGGTAVEQANGDLLIKITASDGLFEIPETAIGDILVVGGGGSGSGAASSYRGNGGGGARTAYEEDVSLAGGVYTATVGAGGATTPVPTGTNAKVASGSKGEASVLTDGGKFEMRAAGGKGGADGVGSSGTTTPGVDGDNFTCSITGSPATYGANGAGGTGSGAGTAGTPNTGNGGVGGGTNGTGGAGGSGVIIVRLKGFIETPVVLEAVTGTLTYGETIDGTVFAGKMKNGAGEEVAGTFAWANAGAVTPLTVEASGTEYDVVFTPENTTYYLPATVKGTLIVNPVAITVTACDTNMLVGCTAPQFKYEVTSGELVEGDELVGTLCTTDTLTVGTHDIVRANDWNNPNYDITFVKGTLTVRAGKVTVNGTGYDNVTDAFNDLLKNKGSATFNDTGIVYDGMTFQRGATLTVAADESWTVTNEGGTSLIATKIPGKMNLTVDGTLELSGDIYVAPAGEDDTVVTVTNFLLDASITVGKESNGATDAMAYLSFNNFYNEKQAEYRITLTTNGVVQSATKLDIAATFAAVEHFEVVEKEIPDGYVYTLEASEFYVKYYDGDEVVHSNKFTILNYMTDLHIWNGTREGYEFLGYTREDGETPLAVSDEALRAYVKDEADDPGCDGEVKVLGTWKKTTATIKIVAEAGITDVQTNGESVVGTLTLPAETTEIKLELVKDDLTIPVYKVITNDVTNVTQRVATYAVVDGLTYTFIAEEAEEDDPDVTPVQKKKAIIDAIDEENKAVVGPKIDAVVDPSETPAEGKVSPDEMATWITENGIQSADMVESDYLVASVKLDAAAPITAEDSISVNNASGTVDQAGIEISLKIGETPVEEENTVVLATGIGTNGEVVAVSLDYDEETGRAQIAPEDPNVDSFVATLSVKSDDGSESIEKKIGYLTKPAYKSDTARELVAVPWASLSDGAAISVADFLVTDNLAEGTKLYSYDRANDRYNAWVLNASKVWEPINTIVIGEGGVVKPVENTPTAADAKIAYGEAVWVERADASTPLVFIGDAGEKNLQKTVTMEKGYNFVSFPNIKTALFRLNRIKNSGEKDFILVPQASGSPRQYTLKEGVWGYDRLYKPAGSKVTKKERVTDDTVDPGSGFEYVRDESTDEAPVVPLVEEEEAEEEPK